jgi:transcription-repair coupling factor (superfamily II helicase)
MIPRHKPLGEIARKRLFALVEASGYGGGMKIAMRDLEIRGAGDILGTQQSGQVASIGFHLYCKLLKRAIDALHKKIVPDFCETKMEFSYDARLPEDYIAETSLRMEIYHRLGEAASREELDELMAELKDRFGPPPQPVLWLKALTMIKIAAAKQRISHMKFETHTLSMEQQKGKESKKLLFPLQRAKTPQDLETQVLAILGKI